MANLSHSQKVTLAILPKVTATLSFLCSLFVMSDILYQRFTTTTGHKKKSQLSTYQRLLLGMSTFDLLMSLSWMLGTWAAPADTATDAYGAMGTVETCELEGLLGQAGVGQALYNATLSVYYVLVIRYSWRPERITRRAEPWLHVVPVVVGLTTMFAGIPLDLYNFGLWDCWINPYPPACTQTYALTGGDDDNIMVETDCERGDNAFIYQWVFHLGWVIASVVCVTINMIVVYWTVLKTERANDKYNLAASVASSVTTSVTSSSVTTTTAAAKQRAPIKKQRKRSNAVAIQSYFYVLAIYVTWLPVLVARLIQLLGGQIGFGWFAAFCVTIPMQGCWNCLAYLRPRYLTWKRKQHQLRKQQRERQSTALATSLCASSTTVPSSSPQQQIADSATAAAAESGWGEEAEAEEHHHDDNYNNNKNKNNTYIDDDSSHEFFDDEAPDIIDRSDGEDDDDDDDDDFNYYSYPYNTPPPSSPPHHHHHHTIDIPPEYTNDLPKATATATATATESNPPLSSNAPMMRLLEQQQQEQQQGALSSPSSRINIMDGTDDDEEDDDSDGVPRERFVDEEQGGYSSSSSSSS